MVDGILDLALARLGIEQELAWAAARGEHLQGALRTADACLGEKTLDWTASIRSEEAPPAGKLFGSKAKGYEVSLHERLQATQEQYADLFMPTLVAGIPLR